MTLPKTHCILTSKSLPASECVSLSVIKGLVDSKSEHESKSPGPGQFCSSDNLKGYHLVCLKVRNEW